VLSLRTFLRSLSSVTSGLLTVLATVTYGCNDVGGVPDWERCTSFLGNPIIEWEGVWFYLVPLLFGFAVGLLVWWSLGLILLRTTPARSSGATDTAV
jgi:hypothetical protein